MPDSSGRPLRVVLFDLDGTLYDERGGMRRALAETLAEAARLVPGLDTERAAALYPKIGRPIWKTADLKDPAEAGGATSENIRLRVWQSLLEEIGVSRDGLAGHLAQRYAAVRRRRHALFPETMEVIERLRGRVRIGLISNGASDIQRDKLDRCRLTGLLAPIVISAEERKMKPDPELFATALARCGCEPREALYVGDSPGDDIVGAEGAGLFSVWVNRYGSEYPSALPRPDATVEDLTGLPPIVEPRLEPDKEKPCESC
jgi:putative hydrolase of the HAD superfamily